MQLIVCLNLQIGSWWTLNLVFGDCARQAKESEKWIVVSTPNWIVKYHISPNWTNKED
jgi:hypothetical protein